MKQNLKTLIFIVVVFTVGSVCLVLLIYILGFAKSMSESEKIGEGYRIVDVSGRDVLGINDKNWACEIYKDSIAIQRYEYNDDFALLFGWEVPQSIKEISRDTIYRGREQTLELFKKENKPFFMIIDKRNDSIHFPLTLTEYLLLRRELSVPDDLQLKLRL